jgi:hypothetical protein
VRSRRWPLAAWALVSAVVGVLLVLLSRAGIAGVVAQLAATIGWAAATMFAVSIVISQGTMPAGAVRQSARMVRANFWTVARHWVACSALGAGALFFVGVVSAGLAARPTSTRFCSAMPLASPFRASTRRASRCRALIRSRWRLQTGVAGPPSAGRAAVHELPTRRDV